MSSEERSESRSGEEQRKQAEEPRPAWRRPNVTRIKLERTLSGSGSNIDGELGSAVGSP